MRINGTCHCGKIAYEADVEPGKVIICHCTDCQKLTGAAYRPSIHARAETFVLKGEPKVYIKTADSGTKRAHAFCPDCGTPIYAAAPENPRHFSLRLGVIAQRASLGLPRRQMWCASALPWSMELSAIPKYERQ